MFINANKILKSIKKPSHLRSMWSDSRSIFADITGKSILFDSIYLGNINRIAMHENFSVKDLEYVESNIVKFRHRIDNGNLIHRYDFFFGGLFNIINAHIIGGYSIFCNPYYIPVPIILMFFGLDIFTASFRNDWCEKYESIHVILSKKS